MRTISMSLYLQTWLALQWCKTLKSFKRKNIRKAETTLDICSQQNHLAPSIKVSGHQTGHLLLIKSLASFKNWSLRSLNKKMFHQSRSRCSSLLHSLRFRNLTIKSSKNKDLQRGRDSVIFQNFPLKWWLFNRKWSNLII